MRRYGWIAVLSAAGLFAQMSAGLADMLREPYGSIRKNLIAAAEVMPEADYGFRPVPEEMSFGQWVAHIADAMTSQCGIVNGQMKKPDAASKTSKADLVAALKASFDSCDAAFQALTDANAMDPVSPPGSTQKVARAGILAYVNAHDDEGYGSMAVYLRLKGIVPPSTAARAAAAQVK
jgi:uncharacterized damage-inducible protein DinB